MSSVLLNLTNHLTLEETDPILGLVSSKGSLLYYNRRFDREHSQAPYYQMRDMLEARALTLGDEGGPIRLMVLLNHEAEEGGSDSMVGRATEIVRHVEGVFGSDSQIPQRLRYVFLFIRSGKNEEVLNLATETQPPQVLDATGKNISDHYVFFLIRSLNATKLEQAVSDVYLKSLVAMLCTVREEEYESKFHNPKMQSSRLFVGTCGDKGSLDTESWRNLAGEVARLAAHIVTLRPNDTEKCEYKEYRLDRTRVREVELNHVFKSHRERLLSDFEQRRKALSALGMRGEVGLTQVAATMQEVYNHERPHNLVPHSDPPHLLLTELESSNHPSTYADVRRLIEQRRNASYNPPTDEMAAARNQRTSLLEEYERCRKNLHERMLQWGPPSRLWMPFLLLAFTALLCGVLSIWVYPPPSPSLVILLSVVASAVVLVAPALVWFMAYRRALNEVKTASGMHGRICSNTTRQLEILKKYLELRDEEDLNRYNLTELERVLGTLDAKRKRVEIWENYYKAVSKKMEVLPLNNQAPVHKQEPPTQEMPFHLAPHLLTDMADRFSKQSAQLREGTEVENVISFVKNFSFTII